MRLIWTDAGFAALVNAENTGTNAVLCSHIAVGRGTTPATRADTALEDEIKRLDTISGQAVDDNIIHAVYRDESNDTYGATEIGLLGDDGTLLARYAQTETIIEKAAGSTALLPIDATLTDVDATQIVFPSAEFNNPPWGENTQGVLARASQALAEAGKDNLRGMSPLRTFQAIAAWLNATAPGADGGLDADSVDGAHLADIIALMNTVLAGTGQDPDTTKQSLILSNHANTPDAGTSTWFIKTIVVDANPLRREQTATRYENESARFYRTLVSNSGVWGQWIRLLDSQQVQTSIDDATPGKIMTVGAFGLGEKAARIADSAELDDFVSGGFGFGTGGAVPGLNSAVFVIASGYDQSDAYALQLIASAHGSMKVRLRRKSNQQWDDLTKVWSSEEQGPGTGMDADSVDGHDAQESKDDTTPGRLLQVGSFGLGALPDYRSYNADSITTPGFSTTNGSGAGTNTGKVITWGYTASNSERLSQLIQEYDTDKIFFRRKVGDTWFSKVEFWTTANDRVLFDASRLNAGILPIARLQGEYGISITGNAATATDAADSERLDGKGPSYYLALANAMGPLPRANASGTYDIDVTGNAATATRASQADNADALGGIEAAAYRLKTDHILPTNAHAFADQISAYPVGVSVMYVRSADGWPSQAGTVVTVRPDEASAGYQEYINGLGDTGETTRYRWTRIYHASVQAWGAFDRVITSSDFGTTETPGIVRRSTDAIAQAGTNTTDYLTPRHMSLMSSRMLWESPELTLPSGENQPIPGDGVYSIYHGRPDAPFTVALLLVCKTAEHGYSVNDEVHGVTMWDWNGNNALQTVTGRPYYVHVPVGDCIYHVQARGESSAVSNGDLIMITPSRWRIKVRAVFMPF